MVIEVEQRTGQKTPKRAALCIGVREEKVKRVDFSGFRHKVKGLVKLASKVTRV